MQRYDFENGFIISTSFGDIEVYERDTWARLDQLNREINNIRRDLE